MIASEEDAGHNTCEINRLKYSTNHFSTKSLYFFVYAYLTNSSFETQGLQGNDRQKSGQIQLRVKRLVEKDERYLLN